MASTSPQQWERGMLVPGRAAVLNVESTDLEEIDGRSSRSVFWTPPPAIHWSIPAKFRFTRTSTPCMELPRRSDRRTPGWSTVHQTFIGVTAGRVTLSYNSRRLLQGGSAGTSGWKPGGGY